MGGLEPPHEDLQSTVLTLTPHGLEPVPGIEPGSSRRQRVVLTIVLYEHLRVLSSPALNYYATKVLLSAETIALGRH